MEKYDYFINAVKAGNLRHLKCIVSMFAIPVEEPNAWENDKYPYRIVRNDAGVWFVNNNSELEPITLDSKPIKLEKTESLFKQTDRFDLPANTLVNQPESVNTTAGLVIMNYLLITAAYGNKIPYINKAFGVGAIEDITVKNFKSDVPKEKEKNTEFYVHERLKFAKVIDYMNELAPIFVISSSRKSMTPPPNIKEIRDKLIEANKDRINELATVAKINAELQKVDSEYLKGDPCEVNMDSKTKGVIRQKQFLMLGAEEGLESNGITGDTVTKSLVEGIDIEKMPAYVNNSRFGSYSRGKQTQEGGVSVKQITKATASLKIGMDDCGTKVGSPYLVQENSLKPFIAHTIIYKGENIKINTTDDIKPYIGKVVMLRYATTCIGAKTSYCKACLGDVLSANPEALGSALTAQGSSFMLVAMKAMHGKELKTAAYDYIESFV